LQSQVLEQNGINAVTLKKLVEQNQAKHEAREQKAKDLRVSLNDSFAFHSYEKRKCKVDSSSCRILYSISCWQN
jgi:hypothetical protein